MKKKKLSFLAKYSIFFLLLSSFIVYFYYSQNKSLINYGGDGFRQYYRALIYIRSHYITILKNVFINRSLVIPQWDFAIGEGSDIIETFHYYGLGDPINLLSVFFKEENLYLFYDISIFLRIYLAGVTFASLCFYKNHKENAILTGSLLYSFCSFSLLSAYGHLLFINSLIYLPLVILGIEKIINDDDWKTLTISVFLSSVSSIYFFYMIVVIVIVYTLVRVFFIKKSVNEVVLIICKITLYSFLGVLISGIIFIPSFYSLINNSRLVEIKHNLLYEPTYYLDLISNYVYSFSYYGGYTVLGLFAIVNLFSNKENKCIKILFIIGMIFCLVPFFGKLFNAMTYVTDRWLFAMDLLMCYIIVHTFDDFINDKKRIKYFLILISYMFFCYFYVTSDRKIYILLALIGIFILIGIKIIKSEQYKDFILVIASTISLIMYIFFYFSPLYWNYSNRGTNFSTLNNMVNEEHSVFDNLQDDSFYRYSGDSITTNQGCLGDKSSTGYYWSVSNSDVQNFRKMLGLSDRNNHHYDNYGDSYILNSLSCVKYYINSNKNNLVPYSYSFDSTINDYDIYKSDKALPLIYGYDSYIKEDDFIKYNEVQRQEILTESAVLIDNTFLEETKINTNSRNIDYKLDSYGLDIDSNSYKAINEDAYIKLNINMDEEGEYYLLIEGLDVDESIDIPIDGKGINKKKIIYKDETNAGYSNRHNYCVNLGYFKKMDNDVYVRFPKMLDYRIDKISLFYLPLEKSINNIDKLNSVKINRLIINDNNVNANIIVNKDKILCFAIPYHNGWELKIDGKEKELYKCNLMYMSSYIDEGEHTIQLEYNTPFLKEGTFVSMFGVLSFIFICIKDREHKIQGIKRKQKHIL